ncbi:unnamed protein product [Cladocopium goreaui]|uniref:Calmodulin-lysine N-methyltransferase n=1 Tax=Cladocopium goreaui TaxID=2562237 RepID=A0A9P1G566_9DINO|nr:unnamed protein product [Cladocopium goreaui]
MFIGFSIIDHPFGKPLQPPIYEEVQCHRPFDLVLAADCSYDFVTPELPCSIDALLATARACGKRALICVSRRKNEVEAFIAAANRAGLDAQVVYTAEVDESKEGVAECLIFSFDFVQPSAIIQKAAICGSMQFCCQISILIAYHSFHRYLYHRHFLYSMEISGDCS